MTDSHFMGTSPPAKQNSIRPDILRGTSSADPSSAVAYEQDFARLVAFSTAPSFDYPAPPESSLLTPVSNAASSPTMQQGPPKGLPFPSSYGVKQQPTPPNASSVYSPYYASSQSPSPLTVVTQASDNMPYNMTRMALSPATTHDPSPGEEVPPPSDQYLGHYTVSGNQDNACSYSGYEAFNAIDPNLPRLASDDPFDVSHGRHHVSIPPAGQTPSLVPSTQAPRSYPESVTVENIMFPSGDRLALATYPSAVKAKTKARNKSKVSKSGPLKRPDASRRPSQATRSDLLAGNQARQISEDHFKLSDAAEAGDKFLFDLRQEYLDDRGKGMWDMIQSAYAVQFEHKKHEALQMQLCRAVVKHGKWPARELKCLEEAYLYVERGKFKAVADRMKETGGCQDWDWKPKLIEAKLVEMGFIEATPDQRTRTRKRTRAVDKHIVKAPDAQHHQVNLTGGGWTSPSGMLPGSAVYGHPQAFDIINDEPMVSAPEFTPEEEEEYINQIFNTGDLSDSPDEMEFTRADGSRDVKMEVDTSEVDMVQSQKVARQACAAITYRGR